MTELTVREHLSALLAWGDAHATLEKAIEGMPAQLRGVRAAGFPHSVWELLDHIRSAQADILDFCVNPDYEEPSWPADYWPTTPEPAPAEEWDRCVRQILDDRAALQALAMDTGVDLTSAIPHGAGQTYLRELILVADHVGQIVAVRRSLGAWDG